MDFTEEGCYEKKKSLQNQRICKIRILASAAFGIFFLHFSLLLITNITASCTDATESKANGHVENNGSYNSDNTPKEGMHTPLKGIGQVSSFVRTVRHHYKKKKKKK